MNRAGLSAYVNPFDGDHLTPERVDMGVDYAAADGSRIRAMGNGVIVEADQAWLGAVGAPYPGTYIVERLTDGPLAGAFIYAAEDIESAVSAGDKVKAGDIIGRFTGGGGIEYGFSSGTEGTTWAAAHGEAATGGDPGEFPTGAGVQMSGILRALGAPPGIISGPVTGGPVTNFSPGGNGGLPQTASGSSSPGTSVGIGGDIIIGILALAGAGVAVWGMARATGANTKIRQAGQRAGQAAEVAAIA